jgi:hypothetical protein
MTPQRPTRPADGERRALRGFLAQHRFGAARVLHALRDGSLHWVRVADPDAGIADDLVIGTRGRVDAMQVKWSRDPEPFTFGRLHRSTNGRSLWERLASGWHQLRADHPDRQVSVQLVSNDFPSTSDNAIVAAGGSEQASFAMFLREAWGPAVLAARSLPPRHPSVTAGDASAVTDDASFAALQAAVPLRWKATWEALQTNSGLDTSEWPSFVASFRFELGAPDPLTLAAQWGDRHTDTWRDDVEAIATLLLRAAADPSEQVEWSRAELLDLLNWQTRVELYHTHDFPAPEHTYRPIGATVHALSTSVAQIEGGYLAVLGSPGSGKSTLLTETLRYRERVIRYYAYIPPTIGSNAQRGEAHHFLHDMVLSLHREGISPFRSLSPENTSALRTEWEAQLVELGAEYRRSGRKTIIAIDGLDHIHREQRPSRSLLAELPAPASLPPGVVIVLGSQTLELEQIPSAVLAQLREHGRVLQMEPLRPEDVASMLSAALNAQLEDEEVAEVYRLSSGHPLAVNYLINRLLHRPAEESVQVSLRDASRFSTLVSDQYVEHWNEVRGDFDLVRLLALLARTRQAFRPSWVRAWADPRAWHALSQRFGHYFRREADRWQFFHNSFRVFLLRETRALVSLPAESALFTSLADECARAPLEEAKERFDELYYRSQAGNDARVVELADREAWRSQFFAGRAVATIRDDVHCALIAALRMRSVTDAFRFLLADAEFRAREHYTGFLAVGELTARLGDLRAAEQWVAIDHTLLVDRSDAIATAAEMRAAGDLAAAERLFALSEPLRWLSGHAPIPVHDLREAAAELKVWAQLAPLLRASDAVANAISRLRVPPDTWRAERSPDTNVDFANEVDEDTTTELQLSLIGEAADALDQEARHDEADDLINAFLAQQATLITPIDTSAMWLRAAWTVCASSPATAARRLSSSELTESVDPTNRWVVAELRFRLHRDASLANELLASIPPIAVVSPREPASSEAGLEGFIPFFRYYRLAFAVGRSVNSDDVVADSTLDPSPTLRAFHRVLLVLARLSGDAWAGRFVSAGTASGQLTGLVRTLGEPRDVGRFEPGAYRVTSAREEAMALMVRIANAHGPEARDRLLETCLNEWKQQDADWPAALRRATLRVFAECGAPNASLAAALEQIEPTAYTAGNLEEELAEAAEQVRLWLMIGRQSPAKALIERSLRATWSVEEKDDQLNDWLTWVADASVDTPSSASPRFATIAGAICASAPTSENRHVAAALIRRATEVNAGIGTQLLAWCIDRALLDWTDAWYALLTGLISSHLGTAPVAGIVYSYLLLPIHGEFERDWLRKLGAALERDRSKPLASAARESVERSIGQAMVASARGRAQREFADPTNSAHLIADMVVGDSDSTSHGSTDRLSRDDLMRGVASLNSMSEVEQLLARLDGDWYRVRWLPALGPLVNRLDLTSLHRLEATLPRHTRFAEVRVGLADAMQRHGDREGARALAESLLRDSDKEEWDIWSDESARTSALEALACVDRDAARAAAWRELEKDVRAGRVSSLRLARAWHRIAPLLVDVVPIAALADEVDNHLRVLSAHAGALDLPTLLESTDSVAQERAIWLEIATLLNHPITLIQAGAARALVAGCLRGDSQVISVLDECLSSAAGARSSALLLVLDGVAHFDPDALRPLVPRLRIAQDELDLRMRIRVRSLLDVLGEAATSTSVQVHLALPASYVVEQSAPLPTREIVPRGREGLLPVALTATEVVTAFEHAVSLAAELASVHRDAIARDTVTRLSSWTEAATSGSEVELRDRLAAVGLRLPFRRPRQQVVERALLESLAVLQDCGRLSEDDALQLAAEFEDADPEFLLIEPTSRPSSVPPLAERANPSAERGGRYPRDDWTGQVSLDVFDVTVGTSSDVDSSPAATADAPIVVAEITCVRWAGYPSHIETRSRCRLPIQFAPLARGRKRVSRQFSRDEHSDEWYDALRMLKPWTTQWQQPLLSDYLSLPTRPSLVVVTSTPRFLLPSDGWMAFNPTLAAALDWRLSDDGLFRWRDHAGSIMAESVW